MCAELAEELVNEYGYCTEWEQGLPLCESNVSELLTRARALLAQPEQVAPTVMEIIELHTWLEDEWRANNDGEDLPMVDYARAVLAKWGNQ